MDVTVCLPACRQVTWKKEMGYRGDSGGEYRSDLPNENENDTSAEGHLNHGRNTTWCLVRVSRECRDHVFEVLLVFVFIDCFSLQSTIE